MSFSKPYSSNNSCKALLATGRSGNEVNLNPCFYFLNFSCVSSWSIATRMYSKREMNFLGTVFLVFISISVEVVSSVTHSRTELLKIRVEILHGPNCSAYNNVRKR